MCSLNFLKYFDCFKDFCDYQGNGTNINSSLSALDSCLGYEGYVCSIARSQSTDLYFLRYRGELYKINIEKVIKYENIFYISTIEKDLYDLV